jgi:2-oxoglutarate dehydrogenase E2 component (dihydrolipoamide succinyltransferase)
MTEIKVPTIGESITEVTLIKWLKKTGEYVQQDMIIAEIESEKATFELNATESGVLTLLVQEGDTLTIGQTVATLVAGDAPVQAKVAAVATEPVEVEKVAPVIEPTPAIATAAADEAPAAVGNGIIDIKIPAIGESITEVTLLKWTKANGALVQRDEIIAELESEKATFEVNAEQAGQLAYSATEGDVLLIGSVIATVNTDVAVPAKAASSAPVQATAPTQAAAIAAPAHASDVKATPVANAIINTNKVDTKTIHASGTGGKILKQDVLEALQNPGVKPGTELNSRNDRPEKMSNLRKTISRRLVEAKNTTAMLTTFNEVDMSPIMAIRKQYKDKFKETHGVNLGFMSFFTKACTYALAEWPAVNAYINGDQIIYHDYADISIAVSAPKGLVVPVIRNAESLSMAGIEKAVVALATKAKEGKLTMEEMTGGTFTITNGGVFGSMLSTPIINLPQSAILGMHNIIERPIAENGQVVIRPMMYVALSYDHRIIDGRESVSFLVRVKELLEKPELLLFGKDPVKTLLDM